MDTKLVGACRCVLLSPDSVTPVEYEVAVSVDFGVVCDVVGIGDAGYPSPDFTVDFFSCPHRTHFHETRGRDRAAREDTELTPRPTGPPAARKPPHPPIG